MASRAKELLEEFINLYRDSPCLWQVKGQDYHDRSKRGAAYELLIDKLKEMEPSANKDLVIKKINNLRSSYRKELKKVKASIKTGNGAEDVYQPKLWYFNILNFLSDQDIPRGSHSTLDSDDESGIEV